MVAGIQWRFNSFVKSESPFCARGVTSKFASNQCLCFLLQTTWNFPVGSKLLHRGNFVCANAHEWRHRNICHLKQTKNWERLHAENMRNGRAKRMGKWAGVGWGHHTIPNNDCLEPYNKLSVKRTVEHSVGRLFMSALILTTLWTSEWRQHVLHLFRDPCIHCTWVFATWLSASIDCR